jgi:hypothetical protein
MNSKYMVVVATMAVMLIGATQLTTGNSAFAYEKSQATSQINDCGNGKLPLNVYCSNTGSQVQGKENAVQLDSGAGNGGHNGDGNGGHNGDGNGGHNGDGNGGHNGDGNGGHNGDGNGGHNGDGKVLE